MSLQGTAAHVAGVQPDPRVMIRVEEQATTKLIERTWDAVSARNLELWLQGPAHAHFENEIVHRFAYQGDRQVGHWPDLADATQNIRAEMGLGPDWPINIRTESMFDVLTRDADFYMGEGQAEMVMPGNAATGDVAKKIKTAQEGSTNNPISSFGPTPPRPVLAADEGDMAALLVSLTASIIAYISGLVI